MKDFLPPVDSSFTIPKPVRNPNHTTHSRLKPSSTCSLLLRQPPDLNLHLPSPIHRRHYGLSSQILHPPRRPRDSRNLNSQIHCRSPRSPCPLTPDLSILLQTWLRLRYRRSNLKHRLVPWTRRTGPGGWRGGVHVHEPGYQLEKG